MGITITVGNVPEPPPEEPKPVVQATKSLNVRKTIDGNIAIFDHRDIDIVLMPGKKKIIAFAKNSFGDHVYAAADSLFKYLVKKGVVSPETIRGGNIYSSIEASIPDSQEHNAMQVALFAIAKFIEQERPYFDYQDELDQEEEDRLTAPDEEDSTEFDPARHSERKGSMRPPARGYGVSTVYTM